MGPNQLEGLPAARKVTIVFNQQLKRLLLARTSRGRRLRQCALFGPLGLLGILLGGCGGSSPFTLPSMPQAIVSKQSVAKPAVQAIPDGYSQPEGSAEGNWSSIRRLERSRSKGILSRPASSTSWHYNSPRATRESSSPTLGCSIDMSNSSRPSENIAKPCDGKRTTQPYSMTLHSARLAPDA
jgi:hypothetical protein